MNWEALGAIAELAGAAGVIITLVYLSYQLRQNTQALRASALQSYIERADSYWDFAAQHAAVIGPIASGETPYDQLTSEQQVIHDANLMKGFNVLEGLFLNHFHGTISDSQFEAKSEGFKVSFRNPMIHEAWQRLQPTMSFTHEFRDFMDSQVFGDFTPDEGSYYHFSRKGQDT